MGATIITKVRLYRTDPLTRIDSLAYPVGAAVPVEEYERLTGKAAPTAVPETAAAAPSTSAGTSAPEPGPAPSKANPTVAELKARLDDLGVAYKPRAKLAELEALVEAAEIEAAEKAKASEPPALAPSDDGESDPANGEGDTPPSDE